MNNWHKVQKPVGAMRAAALGVEERTPCATCHYPDCCCAQLAIEEDLAYITQGPDLKWLEEMRLKIDRTFLVPAALLQPETPFVPRTAVVADIQPGARVRFHAAADQHAGTIEGPLRGEGIDPNYDCGTDDMGRLRTCYLSTAGRGFVTLLAPAPEAFTPRIATREDIRPGARVRLDTVNHEGVVVGRLRYTGEFAHYYCGPDYKGDQKCCYLSRADDGAVTLLAPAPPAPG